MTVEIITPDKRIYSGEASVVTLPGVLGSFQVLKDHAPIISTLQSGAVRVKDAQGEQSFAIKGGVVEVLKNKVIVLAD